jgi:GntR family transcriptional regulator
MDSNSVEPELAIDGGEPVPQQLEAQIRRQIVAGILRPGEELPTVRAVAVGLGVNPHLVEEAYKHLERDGYLIQGEGSGPRVAALPSQENDLHTECREFLRRVLGQGHSSAEVLEALRACLERGSGHGESS